MSRGGDSRGHRRRIITEGMCQTWLGDNNIFSTSEKKLYRSVPLISSRPRIEHHFINNAAFHPVFMRVP